ncbi:MAG: Rpn family recombination-promoting nuclease/putative transposase [Prevotella sp.]|nr:Rpn family recombination-promoting nuclease/putative transposase [Prevotella sp.]
MGGRYINPFTDFGFKRLFGTEMNKELLISFLNSLLHNQEEITDIRYRNTEQLGSGIMDRKAVFDVYCQNTAGEYFIVEMQKAEQDYFKDRSVFYATFPIRDQAQQGSNWDFKLKGVYTVGILDFVFPDDEYAPDCMHHEVKLMDVEDKHVFYDKLTFVYLEMPKFNKTEDQLETMMDKWLYVLRNLSKLMERPAALQERVFTRLFEQAEIARFSKNELFDYEESLKVYRDLFNVVNSAEQKGIRKGFVKGKAEGRAEGLEEGIAKGKAEGRAEGLEEGIAKGKAEGREEEKVEVAKNLLALGTDINIVHQVTGLSLEEISKL